MILKFFKGSEKEQKIGFKYLDRHRTSFKTEWNILKPIMKSWVEILELNLHFKPYATLEIRYILSIFRQLQLKQQII